MNAIILLATLKRSGLSNTETLCEFLAERMEQRGIRVDLVKLANHTLVPGTCIHMDEPDDWPSILDRILRSDIIIFATPIWWNNQSSLMQRVIERLDELHDEILAGKTSRLDGKVGGVVITGDSDGAQTVIANVANFFNAVGILLPPYCTLSVLSEALAKDKSPTREQLVAKFEKEDAKAADKMIEQLQRFAAS